MVTEGTVTQENANAIFYLQIKLKIYNEVGIEID